MAEAFQQKCKYLQSDFNRDAINTCVGSTKTHIADMKRLQSIVVPRHADTLATDCNSRRCFVTFPEHRLTLRL